MLHYSCDVCKRPIDPRADVRHVVRIEVFPAVDDAALACCGDDHDCEADADNLETMNELLETVDVDDVDGCRDEAAKSMRFDLCDACRQRFVKNPLGTKTGKQLDFSNN
jgi:hypothetical protein